MTNEADVHISGRIEWDGVRFHDIPQNGVFCNFKQLCISENFCLIFLDYGRLRVPKTIESETVDEGLLKYPNQEWI